MPHFAEKFSATYGGTRENFFVKASSSAQTKIPSDALKIFCVVQNILQRGSVTGPSVFLKSVLGEPSADEKIYLIDKTRITWNNIKGDDAAGNYPARTFYNELLEKYLGEYSFVRNLILPEADFADILTANRAFDGQQVDFYFPQMKYVFEIDGASHKTPEQKIKDKLRDDALKAEGVTVERINTEEIDNETSRFKNVMKIFLNILRQSETMNLYRSALKISPDDLRVQYDAVMRLQMAILLCLREGIIDLSKQQLKIKIVNSDVKNLSELLTAACEDLKLWIENVAQLAKVKIKLPALKISPPNDRKALALDFCMFSRYADGDKNFDAPNALYVRTDYFPDKDYFKLAAAEPIKYKFTDKDDAIFKFLLKNLFGYNDFRTGQLPIIKNILSRADTIGILPTGTGKSLCFQLSVLLQPGVSIVIAPLVSLIQDQKRAMEAKGITRVAYISSSVAGDDKEKIIKNFKAGKYQFMVVSPERLQNAKFRDALGEINTTMKFSTAIIDEVHCLSEWGHDFRISYLRLIPTLRKYCAGACLLGLTATASQAVLEDLKAEFDNDGSGIKALQSMDRDELTFTRLTVKSNPERDEEILKIIRENDGTYTGGGVEKNRIGLIFCQTVNPGMHPDAPACTRIYNWLCTENLNGNIEIYHGKLKDEERAQNQNHFMEKDFSGLMICTTAFGMGIDKENIKYTIHASLPKSIEEFYQEAGRAGRDEDKSTKSHCYLLHKPETVAPETIEEIFNKNTGVAERKRLCSRLTSDLGTVLYLLNLGKMTPAEECNNILKILAELEAAEGDIKLLVFDNHCGDENLSLNGRQFALYKLTLLGIVRDWTIEYDHKNSGRLYVDYAGVDLKRVKNSLLKYIHKHDVEFSLDGKNTRYEKYFRLAQEKPDELRTWLLILTEWTNDEIIYNRLQSSKNMLDFCAAEVSDEDFRQKVNDFFRYTEKTVLFDSIVQQPLDYKIWFDVLSSGAAEPLLNSLLRYLESYGNNTGLNYLSGMLRLLCGNYAGSDGEWRLADSFKSVKENLSEAAVNKILNKTFELAKNFGEEEKSMLSETLLKIYPEFLSRVHGELNDMYSLSLILDTHTARIKKSLEEKSNGLFGKA